MRRLLHRIPLKESAAAVIVCAIVFLGLLAARAVVSRCYDHKGRLDRHHKERVAELKAGGRHEEAATLRRERTISELEKRIQDFKEQGRVIAPETYVPVWLYKGLKLNLAIAGLLLLASPWLGRRAAADMKFMPEPARPRFAKWQYLACAAVMGFAAWQNAPRLFHSMWGDEEFNAVSGVPRC
jgi:hypothetical protein